MIRNSSQSLFLGRGQPFKVLMDHQNLIYYKDQRKLMKWQVHWSAILQDYDFIIKHILGKINEPADVLSWWEENPVSEPVKGGHV
jgi:hypothetical protein